MNRTLILALGLVFLSTSLCAQMSYAVPANSNDRPQVTVKRIAERIDLDGQLDEALWQSSQPATQFWENFPSDTVICAWQTEIYMLFDEQNLYMGAKCYAPGKDYIITSLKRDFRAGGNDNLTFVIDPFQDNTNAFVFGMNPLGVMREALISNGGQNRQDFSESWDNKWNGASYIGDGFWSCELVIPLSTLRFPSDIKEWNFNAYRFDTQSNTRSSWNRIPQNQMIMSLTYMGRMLWDDAPVAKGGKVALIPYLSGSRLQDFENNQEAEYTGGIGGDAKIAVTSGLNLDLTFNPDFSQVEVDQQRVNLTRFELRFPERRQFFLENADLFGTFGDRDANPFFSRRIGIARDTFADETLQNPIVYGARLSGKIDNNWRVGLLNMQTAAEDKIGLPGYNYTVAAVQRRVFDRSNIGLIFVNKQSFADEENLGGYTPYNRVIGVDYNLQTANNRWNGKVYFHHSLSPEQGKNPFAQGAAINYLTRRVSIGYGHDYVGEGYDAQVGFVPRKNFFRFSPDARIFFYGNGGKVNRHGPGLFTSFLWTPGEGKTDHRISFFYNLDFLNTNSLDFSVRNNYIYLLDDFDPTRSDDAVPLPGEQGYSYTSLGLNYRSDRRKKFSYSIETDIGEFFNGNRYGLELGLTYRYQPFGQITFDLNYDYIDLPEPYTSTGIFLIGPRIDFTFSKSIFLTTFFQYNDQIDNVNINARLQWRFAPVSDFFLVYTDNYESMNFDVKNRAIVAKVTYWLNM